MAGSRLEKLGSVFSRTRDLIRGGVIKENSKPLWYDVYVAFPPKREPTYVSPPKRPEFYVDNVPPIFYQEDVIRAKFQETYGSPGIIDLKNRHFKSTCQRFVEKYLELQKSGDISEDELFEQTGKALLEEGVTLRRPAVTKVVKQEHTSHKISVIDRLKPDS